MLEGKSYHITSDAENRCRPPKTSVSKKYYINMTLVTTQNNSLQ